MRTKLLLVAVLFAALQMQTQAAVSVDRTTQKDYMINSGYSETVADMVQVDHARTSGTEFYTDGEKKFRKTKGIKKVLWKVYNYFDPAAETYDMYHHDIHVVPSTEDL